MSGLEQCDLFNGRPPAQKHSVTSRQAAEAIKQAVPRLQAVVLADLAANGPGTDEELLARTGLAPNTLRPRRVELVLKGLVRDSGRTRPTKSGRSAVLWEVVSP